jgi:hypothetical protein
VFLNSNILTIYTFNIMDGKKSMKFLTLLHFRHFLDVWVFPNIHTSSFNL